MKSNLNKYLDKITSQNQTIQKALKELDGANCLVTGGNGIIGYAISNLLDSRSGCNLNLAVRNTQFKGLEFLSDKITLLNYNQIKNKKYDYIFHCASYSEPSRFLSEWQSTLKLNVGFLVELLSQTKNKLIFYFFNCYIIKFWKHHI